MSKDRLISLDVFRGLTILLMTVVNNPGSWSTIYAPLRHAEWHGCTPTDLVFPFFMVDLLVFFLIIVTTSINQEESSSLHTALILILPLLSFVYFF